MKQIELISPLSRDECLSRIEGAIDGNFTFFGSKPAIGSVGSNGFRLRKRIWYRNSFQTVLRAELTNESGATNIHCRFGMDWIVCAFLVFWFGMTGIMMMTALWRGIQTSTLLPVGLAPWPLIIFGALIVLIGRWIARNERRYLIDFVCRTLEAREISPMPSRQGSTVIRSRV